MEKEALEEEFGTLFRNKIVPGKEQILLLQSKLKIFNERHWTVIKDFCWHRGHKIITENVSKLLQ